MGDLSSRTHSTGVLRLLTRASALEPKVQYCAFECVGTVLNLLLELERLSGHRSPLTVPVTSPMAQGDTDSELGISEALSLLAQPADRGVIQTKFWAETRHRAATHSRISLSCQWTRNKQHTGRHGITVSTSLNLIFQWLFVDDLILHPYLKVDRRTPWA